MDSIGAFLESQPFIALFLVVCLGYAVGKVSIAGLSLGSGAVLFVGLAVGAIAPKAAPPGLIINIGLATFVYGLGIRYGKEFFKGLASPLGIKANLLAAFAVLAGGGIAVLAAKLMGIESDFAAGMYAGATGSTPGMQAAMAVSGTPNPAVSYAIVYPSSIIGPILCFYLFNKLVKPKIEIPAPARLVVAEARADERGIAGLTVAEVLERLPGDVRLLLLRRSGMNMVPDPTVRIEPDDVVSVEGFPEAISRLELGATEQVRSDRRQLDYVRCFVSRTQFVGTRLADLEMPGGFYSKVIQVRRGDVDVLPSAELTIEYGDQVIVLVEPSGRDTVSKYFGDSITAQAEYSFVSLGLGFVLGALLGMVPIPIPGVGSISLGMAGGPLVVGLILGYYGRIGPFNWNLPTVANNVLQGFGISIFLAGVGLGAGAPFVENVAGGLPFLMVGTIVILAVVLIILGGGYYILRMNFDDLLGTVSGAFGNPAIVAYASQLAPTGRPSIVFGMTVPGVGVVLKVVIAQVIVVVLSSGVPAG